MFFHIFIIFIFIIFIIIFIWPFDYIRQNSFSHDRDTLILQSVFVLILIDNNRY